MTSSNGNIFRVTGHLCGAFTSHRWIPSTKASDAELWCLLWSAWMNGWVYNREAGDFGTPSRPLWRHSNDKQRLSFNSFCCRFQAAGRDESSDFVFYYNPCTPFDEAFCHNVEVGKRIHSETEMNLTKFCHCRHIILITFCSADDVSYVENATSTFLLIVSNIISIIIVIVKIIIFCQLMPFGPLLSFSLSPLSLLLVVVIVIVRKQTMWFMKYVERSMWWFGP